MRAEDTKTPLRCDVSKFELYPELDRPARRFFFQDSPTDPEAIILSLISEHLGNPPWWDGEFTVVNPPGRNLVEVLRVQRGGSVIVALGVKEDWYRDGCEMVHKSWRRPESDRKYLAHLVPMDWATEEEQEVFSNLDPDEVEALYTRIRNIAIDHVRALVDLQDFYCGMRAAVVEHDPYDVQSEALVARRMDFEVAHDLLRGSREGEERFIAVERKEFERLLDQCETMGHLRDSILETLVDSISLEDENDYRDFTSALRQFLGDRGLPSYDQVRRKGAGE